MAVSARERGDPGALGDVLEGAVAPVAEEAIAGRRAIRAGREGAALDAVDVEPAVAVVVQQRHAAAERLGELVDGRRAVVVGESQADGLGIVGERGDDHGAPSAAARPGSGSAPGSASGSSRRRGEEVGGGPVEPVEPVEGVPGRAVAGVGVRDQSEEGAGLGPVPGGFGGAGQLEPAGRLAERVIAPEEGPVALDRRDRPRPSGVGGAAAAAASPAR